MKMYVEHSFYKENRTFMYKEYTKVILPQKVIIKYDST